MSIINKFIAKSNQNQGAEMSFIDHIEELRWHIIRSVIAIAVCGIAVFTQIEWIFSNVILGPAQADFISYRALCKLGRILHIDALCLTDINIKFQNQQLSGQFMLSFSSSATIGFLLAFPYIFWEIWRFIKPALAAKEIKYANGIVFYSSLLFFLGISFAYFLIAPFTINFFANYTLSPVFQNIITIDSYYDSMSDLIMGMGIVFELPILVYFLSRVGILTPQLMREKRRYAIVLIMLLAAVITPPDWFSIFLVAIPLVMLYEVGIQLSARIAREKLRKEILDK